MLALYFKRTLNHPNTQSSISRVFTARVTRIKLAALKSQHHDTGAWSEVNKAPYILSSYVLALLLPSSSLEAVRDCSMYVYIPDPIP